MHRVHRLTLQCTLQASDQQFWVLTGLREEWGRVRLCLWSWMQGGDRCENNTTNPRMLGNEELPVLPDLGSDLGSVTKRL